MDNQSCELSSGKPGDDVLSEIVQELSLLHRLYRPLIKDSGENGLYTPKCWTLAMLACEGPMAMSAMARRMQVTKQYITALVDRLVEEGLLTRQPGHGDRRVIMLCITDRGREELDAAKDRTMRRIMASLSSLDRTDHGRLLHALREQKEVLSKLEASK